MLMGGGAVACAKVGQVKIRLKTHDVAGGLGEGALIGGGFGEKKVIVGVPGQISGFQLKRVLPRDFQGKPGALIGGVY